ncbi:dihydrofolate reductase family protein [Agromyces silvae]|uniref:dihydrofolate reductase family protein n=1 Tax=Agromyces silvae TaxID=3388266 RepID=UPI00280A5073|nr:dihydrofolate reductase family protein [Agromyces protaetiae]
MVTFHAFLGCSLDGYIAGPNNELDWLTAFDATGYDEFFASVDAMAMGRHTYDVMREMAPEYYRGMPIHVLSGSLPTGPQPDMGESPITVHADVPSLRAAIDGTDVRRVYADGGRTVQGLIATGLLADLTVTRVPVLIGTGIPLFGPEPGPLRPQLVDSFATEQGAVQSTYRFVTPEE